MHKTITIDTRELIVCGRSGDPYFDHLNLGDQTNDFLIYVSKHHLPDDANIFDIGANIGVTAAILARAAPRGKLFAFEPEAETFIFLQATLATNDLPNCHAEQIALGAKSGEADFFSNAASSSASHLGHSGVSLGGANTSVKISTVDEIVAGLGLDRLDLIKVDVEGFELEVLGGAQNTLTSLKPNVFLEFNSFTLIAYGNQNPRYVLEELMRTFPHVYRFEEGLPKEITSDASVLQFIHDNMIKRGCVDDLFCTFEPITG